MSRRAALAVEPLECSWQAKRQRAVASAGPSGYVRVLTGGFREAALDIRTSQEDAGVCHARLTLATAVAVGLIAALDANANTCLLGRFLRHSIGRAMATATARTMRTDERTDLR